MTALGKVLVFFNLLFSLVVGGLIVVVFVTRTNWKAGYDDAVRQAKAHKEARDVLEKQRTDEAQKFAGLLSEIRAERDALVRDLNEKKTEIANLGEQLNRANTRGTTELTNSNTASLEIEKLKKERDQMIAQITERNAMILKIEIAMRDFRNRAVSAELARDATQEALDKLRVSHEVALNQLNELKARGIVPPSSAASRSAPVEVRGRVTGTSDDLATISLGSDHGLQVGNLLQVYRMTPTPTWVGTLQVIKTEPHYALGKFTPNGRNVIRKDDIVDSKILLK